MAAAFRRKNNLTAAVDMMIPRCIDDARKGCVLFMCRFCLPSMSQFLSKGKKAGKLCPKRKGHDTTA